MTVEPKKKQMSSAMAIAIIALGLSITAFASSYPDNSNNQTSELEKKIDQLQVNMTQFSNYTKAQSTFNVQVINWASQTEQKIEFIANQTAKLQK
jgi:virulence-associated protein VapD